MRLLNLISHRNILVLSGSYTYEGMHNFVFPVANLGDLNSLLENDPPPAFLEDPRNQAKGSIPRVREHIFYEAACGLASALEKLHYYSNDDLNLELIGCHHDLKPGNVLVHECEFILADFGLSTLEKSPDPVKGNRDMEFGAPEGWDWLEMEPYPTGPESDIWSLGCILAVILEYTKDGRLGVEKFDEARGYTLTVKNGTKTTVHSFHLGRGQSNPNVQIWLDEKRAKALTDGSHAEVDLIELIQDMLEIDPLDRPEIRQVVRRLRCVALKKIAEPIERDFSASRHRDALEFSVERHILLEWLGRIGPIAKDNEQMLCTEDSFSGLRGVLHDIADELRLLSDVEKNDRPLFTRLRHSNERLLAAVGPAVQQSIHRRVEQQVVQTQGDLREKVKKVPGEPHKPQGPLLQTDKPPGTEVLTAQAPNPSYIRRIAIANMTQLMSKPLNSSVPKLDLGKDVIVLPLKKDLEKNDEPQPKQDPKKDEDVVVTFRLGKMCVSSEDVVVEEMLYSGNGADETVAHKLFNRMVHVLGVQNHPAANFRTLQCRGFYHEGSHRCFGLVYDFPSRSQSQNKIEKGKGRGKQKGKGEEKGEEKVEVVQLLEMIKKHPKIISSPTNLLITLDERYYLAYNLAAAVYAFHQVGWLHKNISSYNIIFFREDDMGKAKEPQAKEPQAKEMEAKEMEAFERLSLASPFLIGFSHARPNEQEEYSNKTSTETGGDHAQRTLRTYHHPQYHGTDNSRTPYRTAYDYHSLGLVLLEIGCWEPLRKLLSKEKSLDRFQRTEHLRRRRVPYLAAYMGDVYATAVATCLDDAALGGDVSPGDPSEGDSTPKRLAVDRDFERLVLTPLEALAKGYQHRPSAPQLDD
jgi:serine/threonine protein kinase